MYKKPKKEPWEELLDELEEDRVKNLLETALDSKTPSWQKPRETTFLKPITLEIPEPIRIPRYELPKYELPKIPEPEPIGIPRYETKDTSLFKPKKQPWENSDDKPDIMKSLERAEKPSWEQRMESTTKLLIPEPKPIRTPRYETPKYELPKIPEYKQPFKEVTRVEIPKQKTVQEQLREEQARRDMERAITEIEEYDWRMRSYLQHRVPGYEPRLSFDARRIMENAKREWWGWSNLEEKAREHFGINE